MENMKKLTQNSFNKSSHLKWTLLVTKINFNKNKFKNFFISYYFFSLELSVEEIEKKKAQAVEEKNTGNKYF